MPNEVTVSAQRVYHRKLDISRADTNYYYLICNQGLSGGCKRMPKAEH